MLEIIFIVELYILIVIFDLFVQRNTKGNFNFGFVSRISY